MNNPTHINVDINSLEQQICPDCDGKDCCEVFHLKLLPAMLSPSGKEQMLKLPIGYTCTVCGASMFTLPKIEKKDNKPAIQIVPK